MIHVYWCLVWRYGNMRKYSWTCSPDLGIIGILYPDFVRKRRHITSSSSWVLVRNKGWWLQILLPSIFYALVNACRWWFIISPSLYLTSVVKWVSLSGEHLLMIHYLLLIFWKEWFVIFRHLILCIRCQALIILHLLLIFIEETRWWYNSAGTSSWSLLRWDALSLYRFIILSGIRFV